MPLLTSLGLVSLAAGAASGWLVAAASTRSRWFRARGVSDPRAFLQLHLDWVLMGLVLIAVDVAVPDRPAAITALVAVGTVLNPLLFVPLAWGPGVRERVVYRLAAGVAFGATSLGLVSLAVFALASG